VDCSNALGQHRIVKRAARWRMTEPRVITTMRDPQNVTRRPHWNVGLIRVDEFEEFPFPPANQAVAFAKMLRSICNWHLPVQSGKLLALRAGRSVSAGQRFARVESGLRYSIPNGLRRACEFRASSAGHGRRVRARSFVGETPSDTTRVISASWTPSSARIRCPRKRVNSQNRDAVRQV
jgi:hypothetical protein